MEQLPFKLKVLFIKGKIPSFAKGIIRNLNVRIVSMINVLDNLRLIIRQHIIQLLIGNRL